VARFPHGVRSMTIRHDIDLGCTQKTFRRYEPTCSALAWTGLILIACLMPGRWLPEPPTVRGSHAISNGDKLVHFSMFLVFGLLWSRDCQPSLRPLQVLAGGLALGILTELGQELPMLGRDGDFWDFVADGLGVAAGALAAVKFHRFCSREKPG
jgi:hypothetical protein